MPDSNSPVITRQGILDIQVCVPEDWTDKQIIDFANAISPSLTTTGWTIRKEQRLLQGAPERVACDERPGMVHVMLDA